MIKGILADTTRCIGCRGCQVACKQQHDLDAQKTRFFWGDGYQNPPHRTADTWNLVTFNDASSENGYEWIFGRRQCFHCMEPACVAACPVEALKKTSQGPVVYDGSRCIGCRYCQIVCPFSAPRFEWNKRVPEIRKCNMCADRMARGEHPACTVTCATGALLFGDRKALLAEASDRIKKNPDRYVNHIYGENEVGGTCVLHLAKVPFERIGYPVGLSDTPFPDQIKTAMHAIPYAMTGMAAVFGGLAWIINRRMSAEKKDGQEENDS